MLIARGVKAVVVACNTASAAALASLREEFLQTPFIGMVPAVKPAVLRTRSGVVGVLATSATVSGAPLREVVERWAPGVRVLAQPCPGLVDLVERGELNTPETLALLALYVRPLLQAGADTLVLGCTHYPFLVDQLRALIGPHVELLDPAPAIARQTERVLTERGLLHQRSGAGHVRYGTTGDPAALAALVQRLGLPAGAVEAVEIWPAEAGD
jgi:glutamate racemase